MYGDDDEEYFDTMGEEQFATVGYDETGAVVVVPTGSRRTRRGARRRARPAPGLPTAARPAARPRAAYPLAPAGAPVMAPPGQVLITEPRAREIVQEELEKRLPAWFQAASRVPGSSDLSQLMSPLGLGVGTLTNAVNVVTLTAAPQRPFRGERLIIDLARSSGATVVPVRITEFKIGENSQLVGAGALPAEAFDPAAFGVRLAMSPSAPGILILLRIETDSGAVPVGETISVTSAIIGRAVWGETGAPG